MKTTLTIIATLITVLAAGQINKPVAGDFGVKYSVNFNGTTTQSLTFSGMINDRWEFGSSVNVQYSQATTNSIGITSVFEQPVPEQEGFYVPGQETSTSSSKTVALSISPFFLYHFSIKSNLDVYAGANVSVGTGSITLSSNSSSTIQAPNYFQQQSNTYTYPFAYSAGAGIMVGGQYFFYKNLALGLSANLGLTFSGRKGKESVSQLSTNSGSENQNTPIVYDTYSAGINSHSFSLSTSSIGLTLAFYINTKRKAKKEKEL